MKIDTSELAIPLREYPVTITVLDMMTRDERWTLTVPEPGEIEIPSVEEINGGRLTIVKIVGKSGHGAQFPPESMIMRFD